MGSRNFHKLVPRPEVGDKGYYMQIRNSEFESRETVKRYKPSLKKPTALIIIILPMLGFGELG